ncbi:MAG TPA: GSU2403 family nucleotidyltransferase fold protein [Devosia sp.]|nr:GSU2403 family nucleotidyltransferase fold protein [Devosia sp.]
MQPIDPAYQTIYSELEQRCLDAAFVQDFPADGRFVSMESKGRRYWYFDRGSHQTRKRVYVGPVDDPEIAKRVTDFKDLKANIAARRKLVTTLVRDGLLPSPTRDAGDVIAALAEAGLFRLRGVLVGTTAFQCYAALLAVRLSGAVLQTSDADFAQFHSISAAVGDSIPPILEILRAVDPSFRELPHQANSQKSTRFKSRSGFTVEFLVPNTSSDDYTGRPAPMPALGLASAEPLRFLDFLIYEPVRAILLHGPGVPVLVPSPARYAVHKLIVSSRRRGGDQSRTKSLKDLQQVQILIEAFDQRRLSDEFAAAYAEAFDRGPHWREAIVGGFEGLTSEVKGSMRRLLQKGFDRLKRPASAYLSQLAD